MQISVVSDDVLRVAADGVIVNLFEGVTAPAGATGAVDQASGGLISRLIADGDLKGRLGEVVIVPGSGIGARRIAIVGLGKSADFSLDRVRQASASAARALRDRGARRIATIVHGAGIGGLDPTDAAMATVEGAVLGLYRFRRYHTDKGGSSIDEIVVVESSEERLPAIHDGVRRGEILANATNLARDLQNEPANRLTPRDLAERARVACEPLGLSVEIHDEQWMRDKGMGALLGVAQGSEEPPRFVVIRYQTGDARPPIGLIGKGITFDSGGISIKPAEGMDLMKTDMSGAAAVIAAMTAIAQTKPARNVVAIAPTTENMVSGRAQRPGDVVLTMAGKTIEVVNTDAEGRLILADALDYAVKEGLSPLVDLATLTGAMSVALGRHRTGVFTNNDAMLDVLKQASEISGERIWGMPLDEDYFEDIKSDSADMKNSGGRLAGSITAAALLKQFVGSTPWLHLDIAGTARSEREKGYTPKGGTGVGVRTLVHFVHLLSR